MENLGLREKLHQHVDSGDEALINMMWETVSLYNSGNTSSTIEEYNKDINESLEQFRRGDFITQKELEEQSEKW